jgi:hypothetical protein
MNPIYAGTLGLSAAIAGALADPSTADAKEAAPGPSDLASVSPIRDVLAPELVAADARLKAADPAEECDGKCKALAVTEQTLPGTGASDAVGALLYPKEHGLSILKDDGTPAVTFTVMPARLARGQGLVAFGSF